MSASLPPFQTPKEAGFVPLAIQKMLPFLVELPTGRQIAHYYFRSTRGIIEGEEGNKNKWERNDRIVTVEKGNHSYADIKVIDDLGKQFLRELEDFFVNYHELSEQKYRIIGVNGPKQARKRIKDGMRTVRRG